MATAIEQEIDECSFGGAVQMNESEQGLEFGGDVRRERGRLSGEKASTGRIEGRGSDETASISQMKHKR
jgi:hypothetical protein